MVNVSEILGVLDRYNALELDGSPWPTYSEEDGELFQVDYPSMFPGGNREIMDVWGNLIPQGFIGEIEDIIGNPRIESEEGETAQANVQTAIWDVCAWYQPIHYFGLHWGIFIRQDCILDIAREIASYIRSPLIGGSKAVAIDVIRAALVLLYLHEHYHHKVESLGLRLAVFGRRSAYLPYKKKVYRRQLGTDGCFEEALANASSYLRLNDNPYNRIDRSVRDAAKSYLESRFPKDLPGYRMAIRYLTTTSFNNQENFLQAQIREARISPTQPPEEWDIASHMMRSHFDLNDNIWIIVPPGSKSMVPVKSSPYSSLSTAEAKRLAEKRFGFVEKPNPRNPHIKLLKDGQMINLPSNRQRLSPDVIKSYCATLGVRAADLRDLLNSL